MKTCTKCGEVKAFESYYYSNTESRYYSQCKSCFACVTEESKFNSSWYTERFSKEELDLFSCLKSLCTKAKLRKHKFDPEVTWKYLFELWDSQNGRCAYSGLPLSIETNHPHKVSLDRIDSTRGYLVGNLQLVSTTINRMKQEFNEELFVEMCVLVANNQDRKTT